jgi:hypothetical protein
VINVLLWSLVLVLWTLTAFGLGTRVGRRIEAAANPRELESPDPTPVCGCSHHYSLHSEDGVCAAIMNQVVSREPQVMKTGYLGDQHKVVYTEKFAQRPCSCKRYTGPEPLPRYIP